MNQLFLKFLACFMKGIVAFLRSRAAHIRRRITFLAFIVHFAEFADENTIVRPAAVPPKLLTDIHLCLNKCDSLMNKSYYITCRPLGPGFPTGPGIPLKTEISG